MLHDKKYIKASLKVICYVDLDLPIDEGYLDPEDIEADKKFAQQVARKLITNFGGYPEEGRFLRDIEIENIHLEDFSLYETELVNRTVISKKIRDL